LSSFPTIFNFPLDLFPWVAYNIGSNNQLFVSDLYGLEQIHIFMEVHTMSFCSKCGAQNPDGSAFCHCCGSSLKAEPIVPQAPVEVQPPVEVQTPVEPQATYAPVPASPVYSQPNYEQPNYSQPSYNPTGYSAPGYSAPGYYATAATAVTTALPTPAKVLGIISMVCGILSCCTFYAGIAFAIAALVTAGIAKSKTPSNLSNGKANAGLITGIIGMVISIICLIVFIALIAEASSSYSYGYGDYYYDYYDYY
jgi:hypothetical protein